MTISGRLKLRSSAICRAALGPKTCRKQPRYNFPDTGHSSEISRGASCWASYPIWGIPKCARCHREIPEQRDRCPLLDLGHPCTDAYKETAASGQLVIK